VSTDLAAGQVLFRVDRFALTANNISYAAAGDMLKYWDFFPTDQGWGRIPAMGFGDVIASTHDDVAVGTRCFGFYPMSKYLVIEPSSASQSTIVDGVAHRAPLAAVYSQYNPVNADPMYVAEHEDQIALLRGLFMTSFLAEDFLDDNGHYAAGSRMIISSASSKTSIALAFRAQEKGIAKVIGLTSGGNVDFVTGLGFYDEVVTYDEIGSLAGGGPAVFVDMAGNSKVARDVHESVASNLKFSQRIGATHWDAGGPEGELPGPEREFFFAPGQIAKRIKDWGPGGLQERLGGSFRSFVDTSSKWLKVDRGYGEEAVERIFQATLSGSAAPDHGNILSLWDDADAAAGNG
jgi:NADPH:quinone reductase-like Zn-dependent oxidoreductase